jgi:hypothetical protein
MFDLGELAYANFETDREMDREKKADVSLCLWIDSPRRGVEGDEFVEMFVAALAALARGEGVRAIRPPAVFEEKSP